MLQALVNYPCPPEVQAQFHALAPEKCTFTFRSDAWTQEEYHAALACADFILGEVRNEDLPLCKNLKWLQSTNSGVNYYLDAGILPKDVIFSCMTGFYGPLIAEHTLGLLMSVCRRIPDYRDQQHTHTWSLVRYDKPLEDSTVLILGAGDIGTTLAQWLRPMVGRILGIRRTAREYPDCFDEMHPLPDLDDLLPQADFVICILPQTGETVGLLDRRRLSLMKSDAVLVNTGRGSLIDQAALVDLLHQGHFFAVALDVTSPEPLPGDSPLWDAPRLLLVPHAGGNSYAPNSPLDRKTHAFLLKNAKTYLETGIPTNQVDRATGYIRR